MDASPFRERDLDPEAEAFIVGWAREAPRGATLALLVNLDGLHHPWALLTSLRPCATPSASSSCIVRRSRGIGSASCCGSGA